MSKSPSPSSWPAWLGFIFLVVGPPAAVAKFLPTVTENPWLAGGLLLVYEVLVGLGAIASAVIKKMWERRGDALVDTSAKHLERTARLLFADAERRYKEFFSYEHRDLDMKGVSTRGTYTLDLEQVFVEVCIDPTPAHKASTDPIRLPSELASGRHDIWDYLMLLDQHLVVLGSPGSGKTTLLKHLGLCLLQKSHRNKMRAEQLPWTIPLFLPLREHSSSIQEQYSLVDAANKQIEKWKQDIPSEWLELQLQKGNCLILLDGLDEIADSTQRQHMVDWVQHQMLAYHKNRFVVTSRPLGYQSNPLDHVTVLEVQPFTFEQVSQFLSTWYLANEIKRAVRDDPGVRMRANAGAEDLVKRLRSSSSLFAMAVNPLLLTMIATVHLYYGKLPGARITLYKAICEVFLSRRTDISNSPQELRMEQRQLILQVLAYTFMQQGKREMAHDDVCSILAAPLQSVSQTLTPHDFLKHREAITSGLLLEREQGVYGFAHKTFQEYLAMMHILEHHLEHELLTHVHESWWHETILLFCAQADATAVLEACIAQSLPSLEALTLAINCVEEARTVKAEVKERFYTLLEQGSNDAEPERRKVIAEALLKRRLQQMQPLLDDVFIDTSLVTCVEYQLFIDEQRTHSYERAPDIWSKGVFPQGHGRNALLGVRWKDAQAFCEWLTERDLEGQSYRLPRREEQQRIQNIVNARMVADTGYWEKEGSLVWSYNSPSNTFREQVLAFTGSFSLVHDRARILSIVRNLARSSAARDLDPVHALTRASDLASALVNDLASILINDLASTSNLASDLATGLAFAHSVTQAGAHVVESEAHGARSRARARSRVSIPDRSLASIIDLAGKLASNLVNDHDRARGLVHNRTSARARSLVSDLASDLATERDRALALASALDHASTFAPDLASTRYRALANDLGRARDRALAHASAFALAGALAFASDVNSDRSLVRARTYASASALASVRDLASVLASVRDLALINAFEIYLILFLFVYRPESMLPAYEGILLVKESKTKALSTSEEIGS